MDFLAGYVSGAVGIVLGNPLDVLKVRLQSSSAPPKSPAAPSPGHEVSRRQLFKGVAAPILTYGALNALLFAAYNRSLLLFPPSEPSLSHDYEVYDNRLQARGYAAHFLSGVFAGLATFIISTPTELVKCRVQAHKSASNPPTSWSVARAIYLQHGLQGFYFGGVVTSMRDAIGYGFYFWTYEASKALWDQHVHLSPEREAMSLQMKILLCGGIAGVATWCSVFPLDAIKSRMQTQAAFLPVLDTCATVERRAAERQPLLPASRGANAASMGLLAGGQAAPTLSALAVAKQAFKNEGINPFVRGLGVCCARAFIVNAAQFATYEWIMALAAKPHNA